MVARNKDPDLAPRQTILSKDNVLVSLTVAVSIAVSAVGVTGVVLNRLNTIENHLSRLDDRWTRAQMREYNNRIWRDNPSIKVPDPDAIAAQIP